MTGFPPLATSASAYHRRWNFAGRTEKFDRAPKSRFSMQPVLRSFNQARNNTQHGVFRRLHKFFPNSFARGVAAIQTIAAG